MRSRYFAFVPLLGVLLSSCREPETKPLVVLIGLGGASLDFVNELRSEGRLPNFDRLIETGTSGPMQSWPSRRVMRESSRRYLASPILWTSITTKIPEKYGIRDFVLPVPGAASVWIGSETDPAVALIGLPGLEGPGPLITIHPQLCT